MNERGYIAKEALAVLNQLHAEIVAGHFTAGRLLTEFTAWENAGLYLTTPRVRTILAEAEATIKAHCGACSASLKAHCDRGNSGCNLADLRRAVEGETK